MANRESRRLAPVLMLGLAGIAACAPPAVPSQAPPMDVVGQLAGNAGGFALVDRVRPFVFPADHGPHPRFRNEWWYVTANVADSDGEAFGVQFTLFRNALRPRTRPSVSAWATPQLYMAHLAVSDHRRSRFQAFERFARGAVGLAGARAQPFAAWLEDWRLEQVPGDRKSVV